MATTSLTVKSETGEDINVTFITAETAENVIVVQVYKTDDDFNPVGTASISVAQFPSEEEYHKQLREEAGKRGQFVADYSTNPEWNPGYVEPENNNHEFQGDLHQ